MKFIFLIVLVLILNSSFNKLLYFEFILNQFFDSLVPFIEWNTFTLEYLVVLIKI